MLKLNARVRFPVAALLLASAAMAQDKPQPSNADKPAAARKADERTTTADAAHSALDFTVKNIDGVDVPLSKFKGDVVLIVNVASKCGLTPQYEQLQQLHDKYSAAGLRILAFPANDFNQQEPGTDEDIKRFCASKYGVKFDLFSKVVVKGEKACELYKYLTSPKTGEKFAGEIKWNFTKFLVDRNGKVIERFEPKVKPDAPEVTGAIEAALKAPKP